MGTERKNDDLIEDENDEQVVKKKSKNHSRNLSLRTWAKGIEKQTDPSIAHDIAKQNEWERQNKNKLNVRMMNRGTTESFEGYLIRKIGHLQSNDNIGEKLYFRLSDDTLEFSCIDEGI